MMVCIYRVVKKDGLWFIEAHRWLDGSWMGGMPTNKVGVTLWSKDMASDSPISDKQALDHLRRVSSWVGRYLHHDNPVAKLLPLSDVFEPTKETL